MTEKKPDMPESIRSEARIVNRKYKDRLFCFIFGREEHKQWMLSLYNAINGTDHADPEQLEYTTLQEVLFLGMHNDVSVLIGEEMGLFEQQSTLSPNLPLRMLQYMANVFEKHIRQHNLRKYGSRLIPLPAPKLIVLYNGEQDAEDEVILKLSDAFSSDASSSGASSKEIIPGEPFLPDIEVTVRMLNINYGRNPEIMKKCRPLEEYAWFVEEARKYQKRLGISDAVDRAIDTMPKDWLLKPFLYIHKVEVSSMLLTEYDEAEIMEQFREEGIEIGIERGIEQGIQQGIQQGVQQGIQKGVEQGIQQAKTWLYQLVAKNNLSPSAAAETLGIDIATLQNDMAEAGYFMQ